MERPIAEAAAVTSATVDSVAGLVGSTSFYFPASIPKGTYRGVDADISAAAAMTLFIAHEVMAESLAYEITKVLLERTPELAFAGAAAQEISSASAVRGSPAVSSGRLALLQGGRHRRAAVLTAGLRCAAAVQRRMFRDLRGTTASGRSRTNSAEAAPFTAA